MESWLSSCTSEVRAKVSACHFLTPFLRQHVRLAAMKPTEIIVTWWCCRCGWSGRVAFYHDTSVGGRLDAARAEHNALSPKCELDWHQVFVRTDVDERQT